MLTPVRAVSNTDISFNSYTSQQQGSVASTMTPNSAPAAGSAPQENTNLGRASVLALSGQLQLSQSVTVLAEALGRMLNIPRKDAESVDDYVNRLVQTIRGLSSSEREVLNQQLAKVLQGLTLKIIAEVLKNPAGPDAARLAVLLEMTRYKGDLAAKAVVSSYRQNTGNDLIAALPAKDQAAGQIQQGTQTRPAAMQGPPTQADAAGAKAAEQAQKASLAAVVVSADDSVDDAKTGGRQGPPATASAHTSTAQQKQDASSSAGVKQDMANAAAQAPQQEDTADDNHTQTANRNVNEAVAPKSERSSSETLVSRDERALQRSHVDARTPEIAKNAEAGGRMELKGTLTKTDLENLLLTSLAGQKLPQRAEGSPTYLAAISQMLEITQQDAAKPGVTGNAAGFAASASSEPETPLPTARNAVVMPQGLLSADAKAALEQPFLQSALASLTKEGIGMPFVANPQAKDEADSSSPHRGRWPSSSDEGGEGQQDDQAQGDEAHDEQAQDEQAEADRNPNQMADGQHSASSDTENAQAYYLRMGGLA